MIEEDLPLAESIEWRLSDAYWNSNGTAGFVKNEVPFTVTSSGTLSADAARLLFLNCCEHEPTGHLEVLEFCAGTGLFARLFLDEFARLCEREGKAFHRQLTYYVTDRSQISIEQWKTLSLFDGLPAVPAWPTRSNLSTSVPQRVCGVSAGCVRCSATTHSIPCRRRSCARGKAGPRSSACAPT
jgi:hypothetical protein